MKRLLFVLFLLLAACTADPDGPLYGLGRKADTKEGQTGTTEDRIATTTGLPCDVDAVLKEHCQTCHGSDPQFGARTSLVTWADFQKPSPLDPTKKVYELVAERLHDEAAPMPPSPKPRLDAVGESALDMWLTGGAKESDATCENPRTPHPVKPLSCKADTVLKATKPFTLPANAPLDQYVCFGVDQYVAKKQHIVGLAPKLDNAKIVHHILLFQTDAAVSGDPFLCPAAGLAPWRLVAGWNPGGNNLELPPEAGFPAEEGTTHWVLQIHYNNAAAKGGVDQSGYELCTTENLRKYDAGIAAFGSTSFAIPPRSTHSIRCDIPLDAKWKDAHLWSASPHMHTLGTAMSTERIPADKSPPTRFFEEKNFSFDAQANYPVSVAVAPGDVIRTRCSWKNPSDATVTYGESSRSEMCFDFIGYYPRIPSLPWVAPAVYASCSPE